MARNFRAILALALFTFVRSAAASGMDAFPIATQTGLRYENAHAADDMRTVVAERVRTVPGSACPDERCSDVVLIDLRAKCGSDRIRYLSTDGRSRSCSIDERATRAAWLSLETTTTKVMVLDLTDPSAVPVQIASITSGDVSNLNLGHDAKFVAFLVDRGSTGVEIDRFTVTGDGPDVVAAMPMAGQLTLNSHHALGNDGLVTYSKLVGLTHDVLRRDVGGAEVNLSNTPDADERVSSISSRWPSIAYIRTEPTGLQNVWAVSLDGSGMFPMTANIVPEWRIFSAGIAYGSVHVAFVSNGNLVGANPDLSREAFIVEGGGTFQMTEHSAGPPPSGPVHQVFGAEIVEQGKAPGLGVWVSSNIMDMNSSSVSGTSFHRTVTDTSQMECETYSPFRTIFGPSTDPLDGQPVDCIVGVGCQEVLNVMDCSFGLANSEDDVRSFQLWPTWNMAVDSIVQRPETLTLGPGETVRCTVSNRYISADGSLSIVVTSADGTRTDARSGSLPFTWP